MLASGPYSASRYFSIARSALVSSGSRRALPLGLEAFLAMPRKSRNAASLGAAVRPLNACREDLAELERAPLTDRCVLRDARRGGKRAHRIGAKGKDQNRAFVA